MSGELFERFEPPPGGLTRLNATLDVRVRSTRSWAVLAVPLAVACALWFMRTPAPTYSHPALIAAGIATAPRVGVTVLDGIAVSESSADEDVLLVWVAR